MASKASKAQQAWADAVDATADAPMVPVHPDATTVDAATRTALLDAVANMGTITGAHSRNGKGDAKGKPHGVAMDAVVDALRNGTDAATRTALASNALHSTGGSTADAARALATVLYYVATTGTRGSNGLWGCAGNATGAGSPGTARNLYAATVQGAATRKGVRTAGDASASAWATNHGKRCPAWDAVRGVGVQYPA